MSVGAIENGELRIGRPASAMLEDVDELVLDLYRRLPEVRITDILLEVDTATGFTDVFTHLCPCAPCQDRIVLLNVLRAKGRWEIEVVESAIRWSGEVPIGSSVYGRVICSTTTT